MPKQSIKLESIERLLSAPDDRQLAEASLAALREVADGDHFSAILFNPATLAADVYFSHKGWLPSVNDFRMAASGKLIDHPLARKFLSRREPMALLRSREVSDREWHKSAIYNEVDRPLDVKDVATAYLFTASNRVLILTCGRSRRFLDREFSPLQAFHRVLNSMAPFQPLSRRLIGVQNTAPGAVVPVGKLADLTVREHEILHWVREGKRDLEIGIILGISPRTVHHHVASIYHKLGVETRTAAAVFQ